MTSSTALPPVTASHRPPRQPPDPVVVAAGVATTVTAFVPATAAVVAARAAARAWAAAGPRGLNDPDLRGVEALFAGVGAVLAAVVTVLLLVAVVRQARSSSRESGTRAAAYLHVLLAFATVGGLVQPSSFWPTVAGAVVVVDGLIVWFAVNHHWRRARRHA